jgi:hypothetical protein
MSKCPYIDIIHILLLVIRFQPRLTDFTNYLLVTALPIVLSTDKLCTHICTLRADLRITSPPLSIM